MASHPDWIHARSFAPRRLPGLTWRTLCRLAPGLARSYLDHLLRAEVHEARVEPRSERTPISLLGAFELDIGVARAAQILRSGLEAANIPVHPMDCSAVLRPMPGPPRPRPAAPASGTMVFCVNPPQMTPQLRHFGPRICRGKRLVGYWWWELDRVPRDWLPWAALMDEIWVSSRFVHDTFARGLPGKPVRYVPLPVPEPRPAPLGRGDFGLAQQPFTVLAAFDLSSHWARKNPTGAIAAFRHAFPDAGEAQLVLKVGGADQHPEQLERLRALSADRPDIRIVDRALAAGDLAALIRCADVLLSLHRAEGFGLFIAEAMWLGTAVVATGWSGVMDMLDEHNALLVRFDKVPVRPADYASVPPGSEWAEPDIGHAAECLRRLAQDPGLRDRLREQARRRAEDQFSLDRFRAFAPSLLEPMAGAPIPNRDRAL
jgi:glycosyltransferase involved in cell wall biosynthesis